MREKRYQEPGAPPGTLTPLAEAAVPGAIHVIHYSPDTVEEADLADPGEAAAYKDKPGVTWVNVDGLGDLNVIRELGRVFDLHPLALEDSLNVPQRPKVDEYEKHLYLVVQMLHYEDGLTAEQVSVFLGSGFVITFQEAPGDCLDPVRERLRKGAGQCRRQGADYLMYCILDAILDHYFPFLERLGEAVEGLEDNVVERPDRRTIASIHNLKRDLLYIRRCVWPLRDVVNALLRDETALVGKNTRLYLRDCYDHTIQILDVVQTYREVASSLVDVYLSSVSNKMNQVMKVLTVIATIFMPLTFIAGVYGMNFRTDKSPFNMPELTWYWGYPAFWLVIVLVTVLMLVLFRRKGWLGGPRGQ